MDFSRQGNIGQRASNFLTARPWFIAPLLVLLFYGLNPSPAVSANGVHIGSQTVFQDSSGPYLIQVDTMPLTGILHLAVNLRSVGGGSPVEDASIRLTGQGPEENPKNVGPVSAVPSPDGPGIYTVDIQVDEPGQWMFAMDVDSPLGQASVGFPVRVQEPSGLDFTIWLVALAVVLLMGAWYGSYYIKKRRRVASSAHRETQ